MTDRLMALLAVGVFAGFLAILLWFVPRWDLGGVLTITFALVLWDIATSAGRRKR